MQFLVAAICVAVIVATAWVIRWVLRLFGVKPPFVTCCLIAIVLLAFLAEFCLHVPVGTDIPGASR